MDWVMMIFVLFIPECSYDFMIFFNSEEIIKKICNAILSLPQELQSI